MIDHAYAVIMAGGKGQRFWPLSRSGRPKQVLSLFGKAPLMALAVERLGDLVPPERVIVITGADLVDVTRKALPCLPRENIIGEPFGRDTAAACALAAAVVHARDKDGLVCVLAADHIIKDVDIFQQTLTEGFDIARENEVLLTIGINPTFASTGFGYIEAGDVYAHAGEVGVRRAKRFVEKPDISTARQYLASGDFFWNSGMFIWSVGTFLNALAQHCPHLGAMARRLEREVNGPGFPAALEEEYGQLDKISVDYAIMEKADNIVMARGTFRWYDVGSWPALEDHFDADADGNVCVGPCEALDASCNVVVSPGRLTALIGVQNLVVVQAEGATLVCARERAQDVKQMVAKLERSGKYNDVL